MDGFADEIIRFIQPMSGELLYFILFVSAIVENLLPPIPGDTITVLGAFLVGTGRLNFWGVYISTTLGSVTGFMALVFIGRIVGRKYFHDKNYRHFPRERIIKTEEWINSHGYLVVLVNRFFPGIRSVISIVSGMSALKNHIIFLFALLSALVWNLIWIYAGFSLGNNWDAVKEKINVIFHQYNIAMVIIIAAAAVFILIKKKLNVKKTGK